MRAPGTVGSTVGHPGIPRGVADRVVSEVKGRIEQAKGKAKDLIDKT